MTHPQRPPSLQLPRGLRAVLGRCWDPQNYLDVGLGTSSGTLMGQGGDRVDMGCLQPQPLFCEDPQKQPSTRPCPITKPRPSVPQKKIHIEHFSRICTPKICHGTASPSALHPLRLQILGGDLPKEEGSRRSSSCGTPRVMLLPVPTPPSSSWFHEMPPKQVSLEKKNIFSSTESHLKPSNKQNFSSSTPACCTTCQRRQGLVVGLGVSG